MNDSHRISADRIGFYRSANKPGWATYDRKTGVTRTATAEEVKQCNRDAGDWDE